MIILASIQINFRSLGSYYRIDFGEMRDNRIKSKVESYTRPVILLLLGSVGSSNPNLTFQILDAFDHCLLSGSMKLWLAFLYHGHY